MPTRTAATAPAVATIRQVAEIQAECRAILEQLSGDFLERADDLFAIFTAMLSAEHVFLLGPPGTGKSAMVRALCARFLGARYWEILMDKQLGKEESFGPIDLAKYDQQGVWTRDTTNTLADCHIAFVDEVGKAGPASLNPYLTAFNERLFKNEGGTSMPIPLISAVGASNELLEPDLAAMWDRFLVRRKVKYLVEPDNFIKLLESAVRNGNATTPATITLDEYLHVVHEVVPKIQVPVSIFSAMEEIKTKLLELGNRPSDRRYKQAVRLLQASAFLSGHDIVDEDDLAILCDVLWETEAQVTDVQNTVLSYTSPIIRQVMTFHTQIANISSELNVRHGTSAADRASYGADAQHQIQEMARELKDLIEQANREGRSTIKLMDVKNAIRAIRTRVFVECLGLPESAAEAAANSAGV